TDRVALPAEEVADRGGETGGVAELRDACRVERHRPRRIDDENRLKIRLVLVLAHEVAIGPRPRAPVEEARIVARSVEAVLRENVRRSFRRASVVASQETACDRPSDELERLELSDGLRIEDVRGSFHRRLPRWFATPGPARGSPREAVRSATRS